MGTGKVLRLHWTASHQGRFYFRPLRRGIQHICHNGKNRGNSRLEMGNLTGLSSVMWQRINSWTFYEQKMERLNVVLPYVHWSMHRSETILSIDIFVITFSEIYAYFILEQLCFNCLNLHCMLWVKDFWEVKGGNCIANFSKVLKMRLKSCASKDNKFIQWKVVSPCYCFFFFKNL